MKVLVVGSGGREHTLVWKLSRSPLIKKIYAAPGNAGIAQLAECVAIKATDLEGLAAFAENNRIHLTVVGPELPLTLGIVDLFEQKDLKIVGPQKLAAQIEGSKVFAKEFMQRRHIPTASYCVFRDPVEALEFSRQAAYPLVIKADGLAAGKGAFVVENHNQAADVIQQVMVAQVLGTAGQIVVIERFLAGNEVTVMAFTDGKTVIPMVAAQDHKRALDGDQGPNTGGMGAFAPTGIVNEKMMLQITSEILEPAVWGLAREGRPFKGILYAGLMFTEVGPKVLEFNCRFGDPETQVVLPLLKNDLMEIFMAIVDEQLVVEQIEFVKQFAVCVVLASQGYPEKFETGKEIFGLPYGARSKAGHIQQPEGTHIFCAGVKSEGNRFFTDGGRVLGVTAVDNQIERAISRAYAVCERIRFDGKQYRKDIGYRANQAKRSVRTGAEW